MIGSALAMDWSTVSVLVNLFVLLIGKCILAILQLSVCQCQFGDAIFMCGWFDSPVLEWVVDFEGMV